MAMSRPPFVSPSLSHAVDAGLRAHMLSVYNYMAVATGISGVVAWLSVETGLYLAIVQTSPILLFAVALAPLAVMIYVMARARTLSPGGARMALWIFAVLMGVSLASILIVYTAGSVTRAFLISAAAFLALSMYGYLTKRDLSGMRSFLFMGVIGIILAMVVNLFVQSSSLDLAISVIGVLIFAGLTAYDTQRIKNDYLGMAGAGAGEATLAKSAALNALTMYLNFLNMFLFLLRFIGERR